MRPLLQALYAAEVDVSLHSQWDAGWVVELTPPWRLRRIQWCETLDEVEAWLSTEADSLAPGWRHPQL